MYIPLIYFPLYQRANGLVQHIVGLAEYIKISNIKCLILQTNNLQPQICDQELHLLIGEDVLSEFRTSAISISENLIQSAACALVFTELMDT